MCGLFAVIKKWEERVVLIEGAKWSTNEALGDRV